MPKVGVLTGGGDCPGLNAVIRAVTRTAINNNWEVIGIKNGWRGLIDKDYQTLNLESVSGILPKGGTILGTSRTNPYKKEEDLEKVKTTYKELNLEALITIGGEDTLGVANKLSQEGLNIVGVPKTIDNDLNATDYTFGFDTAVNIATECIDRLHTTAESHHRIIVVEVMGRHAGWIAVYSGLAGGADVILIPEIPIDIEEVCQLIEKRHNRGKTFSIIVVAEGAKFKNAKEVLKDQEVDEFGHVKLGGIGNTLGKLIEDKTGYETRVVVLGHIQRGGTPTAFDRILATRYGVKAMKMALEKKYGKMVALRGNQIIDVPLQEAVAELKTVDLKIYEIAKTFFG
ncbi:MAG TPA: 6-phosphofructokinase [Candidatus Omnitrophica bacterium]|nr:MAG: 6-phosphofructokinase [Candidatus Omnitrophota bacterium]RKY44695.1 MAG: 6-phosphofructokinase [Candidatus Omnitrophota bacterium]HEC68775.1 6-phosphofructokinase [Candidatus Omnitrophota bacterium]